MDATIFMENQLPVLDEAILKSVDQFGHAQPGQLKESMVYSLNTGGKRIRPMLLLATLKALNVDIQIGLNTAVALEYIHTYSLIHDDLPAMDNDDYRRGKLTNHKAFDEATAILAGDSLLTDSFALIANDSKIQNMQTKVNLIAELSKAAGSNGMIAGQILDVDSEGKQINLRTLQDIHKHKTGELIRYAVFAGGQIAQASSEVATLLDDFAWAYGIAYQIQNDLQEVMWTDEARGKLNHSDAELDKNTYPSIMGTNGALSALSDKIDSCKSLLDQIQTIQPAFDVELLAGFLKYLKI
ncbi:Farnesyl diphosphate synthase [Aerococcus viridans]|uniref:Farnesyl diphosphate synthase n=2 Tax=Aerococcus viridans TaxID=1377 RepID=A0AAU8U546_9LACT|nr:farnesyl diphosphate synthase [Aerococcus viridans]AMC01122.1 geranyl transferase [Aerococcus viridans]EFG49807.1 polyprenyl synthetase [Aerococcus viridans ATCC 11563 = CCUG 4311]SUU17503.1 Farnesyl diphosphate synthase [Aerococcus viridans]